MSGDECVEVRIMRLPHGADLPLPEYQSALAAGLDLLAAVPAEAPLELAPGARAAIPTGVAIALPPGNEGQIRPRSGLALRHGVTVLNSPGTVDADYRGELQVILVNLGSEPFVIQPRHAHRANGHRAGPTQPDLSKRAILTRPSGPPADLALPERLRKNNDPGAAGINATSVAARSRSGLFRRDSA